MTNLKGWFHQECSESHTIARGFPTLYFPAFTKYDALHVFGGNSEVVVTFHWMANNIEVRPNIIRHEDDVWNALFELRKSACGNVGQTGADAERS